MSDDDDEDVIGPRGPRRRLFVLFIITLVALLVMAMGPLDARIAATAIAGLCVGGILASERS